MGRRALRNKFPVRTPHQEDVVRTLFEQGYSILVFACLNALISDVLAKELEEQIASGRRPLVFREISKNGGKVLKYCTPSGLRELGVNLPSTVVHALGHDPLSWAGDGAQFDLSQSILLPEYSPDVSLSQIKESGSIEVAFPEWFLFEGKWTVIDGLTMVRSGFEALDESPPKPPKTLKELDVVLKTLRHVTGYDWTRTDGMKLLSSTFVGFNKLLPKTYGPDFDLSVPSSTPSTSSSSGLTGRVQFPPKPPRTVAELHQAFENLRIVTGIFDMTDKDAMKMLNSSFEGFSQHLPEIFEGVDSAQTHIQPFVQGTGITCIYGVGLPALQPVMTVNASDLYWVDYVKAIAYGSGCLSIMISWMFSNRRRKGQSAVALAKARVLQDLGDTASGCAFFSMAIGVFCNTFSCIPLSYITSCICSCMVLLITAASFSSQPLDM